MGSVLIVGDGVYLKFVCRGLVSRGHEVTLVVKDEDESLRLAEELRVVVVHGNGTLPDTLKEAGILNAHRVFALTSHDEDNYLVCALARHRFGIGSTFALVHDPENEAVFRELGIVGTFSVTAAVSSLIDQRSASESIRNLQPLADGRFGLTEAELGPDSPATGKELRELALPEGALLVTIVRGQDAIVPRGNTRLELGDRVGFIYLAAEYARTLSAIVGKD